MKKDTTKRVKSNYEILTNSERMKSLKKLGQLQELKRKAALQIEADKKKTQQTESPAAPLNTAKQESELKPIDYENMQPVFPSMYSWPEESVDSLAKQFAAFKKKRKYF